MSAAASDGGTDPVGEEEAGRLRGEGWATQTSLNPLRCPSTGALVTLGWKDAQVGHSCVPRLD